MMALLSAVTLIYLEGRAGSRGSKNVLSSAREGKGSPLPRATLQSWDGIWA